MWEALLNFPTTLTAQIAGLIIFVLLIRLIAVFFLSRREFWREDVNQLNSSSVLKLAQKLGKELPFMTIFIPAKNEAAVIQSTILAMTKIDYPLDRYEIVVITDAKERRDRKNQEITTQEVVEATKQELAKSLPDLRLIHEEVPYDFDGRINGKLLGREVPSTKGRALNWALSRLNEKTDFCVFYDTDGHPHPKALLSVAKAYLEDETKQVFQCPIFQVRNFWQISSFTKVAALAQAFTHEIFLPRILKRLPFVGGTNLFVKKEPLLKIGGFSPLSLTEDLDFGTKLYLFANQWPHFLPIPSSEQTPPTIRTYFKQRMRWGLGQLSVINFLLSLKRKNVAPDKVNKLLWKFIINGPCEWFLYFFLTIVSLLMHLSRASAGILLVFDFKSGSFYLPWPQTLVDLAGQFLPLLSLPLLFFVLLLLWRYRHFIAGWQKGIKLLPDLLIFMATVLFALPFIFFLYPLPFIYAFMLRIFSPTKEIGWAKTPRTAET